MALTPKQEAFCIAYIETGNASEAYRRAYDAKAMKPATVNRNAKSLLDHSKIATRLAELRKPAADAAKVTLEGHLRRLDELSLAAERVGQYSAAISAEVARGKAAGVAVDKTEITGAGGMPFMPPIINLVRSAN
jgi:phage terminase small subunit